MNEYINGIETDKKQKLLDIIHLSSKTNTECFISRCLHNKCAILCKPTSKQCFFFKVTVQNCH